MVTNPVDVLARLFATTAGEAAQVYGIGSSTDSARYRIALATHHRVPPSAVHGWVIGEHGDGAVICASTTTVNGSRADVPLTYVRAQLADRPRQITAGIGRTRCGPAGAVLAALRKALAIGDGTEVLSVNHDGVWLGIRCGSRPAAPPCACPTSTLVSNGASPPPAPSSTPLFNRSFKENPRAERHPHSRRRRDRHGRQRHQGHHRLGPALLRRLVERHRRARHRRPQRQHRRGRRPAAGRRRPHPSHRHRDPRRRLRPQRDRVRERPHPRGPARDGAIYATQPTERLAYHYDSAANRLVIVGAHAQSVAVAASRLARELIRGQLLRAGFHILHASCVVRNGRALLTFGPKGAGKTTTALLLAREGFELLANDRVFIRPEDGGLQILPWPSAAAIGFGLLESTDLYEPLRARILEGEQMHPPRPSASPTPCTLAAPSRSGTPRARNSSPSSSPTSSPPCWA
ncbi:hypothetical protein NKH18_48845 [Streptomyces sp. M10(2022)]